MYCFVNNNMRKKFTNFLNKISYFVWDAHYFLSQNHPSEVYGEPSVFAGEMLGKMLKLDSSSKCLDIGCGEYSQKNETDKK